MEHDDLDEDNERLQIILQDYEEGESDGEFIEIELNDEEYVSNPSRPSTSSDFTASTLPTTSVCTDADDVMIRFDPNTITSESCLAMNRAYQEVLLDTLRQIEMALFENRACQKQLEDSLQDKVWSKKEAKFATPNSWLSASKILPYFKDILNGELPPPNPDVKLKEQMNEDKQHVKPKKRWSKQMRKTLIDAIKVDALEQVIRPALNKVELEMEKLQRCKSRVEINACKARIEALKEDVKTKQSTPADELLKNVDARRIDFLKISAIHFDNRYDSSECESMWNNVLRPGINRDKWTAEEDEMLNKLAEQHRMRNWQQIAEELGTHRTPYQCLQHYQHKNTVYDQSGWREEEDQMLKEVIENFAFGSSKIQWFQVAYYIDNRSANQCMKRWLQINPEIKKGRWTSEEDEMLREAVKKMGVTQDWVKIQEMVHGRSATQCRERYARKLGETYGNKMWTYEEDKELLLLQQQYGNMWIEIAKHMDRRTDATVQSRYKRLMNWKAEMDHFDTYPQDVQQQRMHNAFEFGVQGEIKIKPGLQPNKGSMILGRPIGAKSKVKRKSEGIRLREEVGMVSSDEELEGNYEWTGNAMKVEADRTSVEEIRREKAEARKERAKRGHLQKGLDLFVGYYNIDPHDYRKQKEDMDAGNVYVPRPVPSKTFRKRKMPSVWQKRKALMALVQTQLELYLIKIQGMSHDDTEINLYDEISNKMNIEGATEEEKKKLIFSAFGGKNPSRLTVRELLTISRQLKEQGSFPRKPYKKGEFKHKWRAADTSDEDVAEETEEEEWEGQDGAEEGEGEDDDRIENNRTSNRGKAIKEKMALHTEVNRELKKMVESKMDHSEFNHCGRKKKFCIYPRQSLLKFNGIEEDKKLNRKSMALLIKALDVDGKKAYVKAVKGRRKISAMAMLKSAEQVKWKRAKTRRQKTALQKDTRQQKSDNAAFVEVSDYILDVHDELKVNDDEVNAQVEAEEMRSSTITKCEAEDADDSTRVEKTLPYLPPNQTTLHGMRGLLLEHRRLIDQADTYFNPADLRDQLYDLKNKGSNPFMGVLNAVGKTQSAFKRKSKELKRKKKKGKVTISALECSRQLNEARQSEAYQLLKARFQSMFSWPALTSTIPPPRNALLPMSLRELANQKTLQQLKHIIEYKDDSNTNNAGQGGSTAVGVAAGVDCTGEDYVDDEGSDAEDDVDENLTEEEAIEKLVERIMQEYEGHRAHRRGPPKKKSQQKYARKERTEILKKLGLWTKMQEYERRRKLQTSNVAMATTSTQPNDITLPSISEATPTSIAMPTSEAKPTCDATPTCEAMDTNESTNNENTYSAEATTVSIPTRPKGRPKGSKQKRIELSDSEKRKSQRNVTTTVERSPARKKRCDNSKYKSMRELIPKKMSKLMAQISEIPLLNEPLPEEDIESSERANDNDTNPNKTSTKKVAKSKKSNVETVKSKEERLKEKKKKAKATKDLNRRLGVEVRHQIKQEILEEFEQIQESEGMNEDELAMDKILTSPRRQQQQQLEGAEALVALANNTGKNKHSAMMVSIGHDIERAASNRSENSVKNCDKDQGRQSAKPVGIHESLRLEKITTLKIPRTEQSNSNGVNDNAAAGDRNKSDKLEVVTDNSTCQEPVFIGVPVVVGGASQMACIPVLPDKDGKIKLLDGSKVDANINAEQSVVSINVNPSQKTSGENQT